MVVMRVVKEDAGRGIRCVASGRGPSSPLPLRLLNRSCAPPLVTFVPRSHREGVALVVGGLVTRTTRIPVARTSVAPAGSSRGPRRPRKCATRLPEHEGPFLTFPRWSGHSRVLLLRVLAHSLLTAWPTSLAKGVPGLRAKGDTTTASLIHFGSVFQG